MIRQPLLLLTSILSVHKNLQNLYIVSEFQRVKNEK